MSEAATQIQADQELDIRGVVCPITFVKSKLTLERMQSGQVLRVLIDYPPSALNVPRSLEHEGHQILGITESEGPLWTLLVRKA
ncbi:MAG: sulfurtransferase TusA family protein [Nitrospirota bacterium]|nr:sulfurtransferase TusA family protein [Nitrospirota bacterium]